MAQQKQAPFRKGTRIRYNQIPFNGPTTFSITTSAPPPLQVLLPSVGMLSRIMVKARNQAGGGVTTSAAGAFATKGPWNMLKRLQVSANLGFSFLYDTDGFMNYTLQKFSNPGWLPDQAGVGASAPYADVYAFPNITGGAVTNQPFELTYIIPIALNFGLNFELGLINLQSPEIQVYLTVQFGALSDVLTNGTSITGLLDLSYEFFDIGPTALYQLPPNVVVRTLMDTIPIANVGDNPYTVPRMGTLIQACNVFIANGARSDGFDGMYYRFNRGTIPEQRTRFQMRAWERQLYETNPITGVSYLDLFHAFQGVNAGDLRDSINTERLATFEWVLTVSSGTALGAGNNTQDIGRRVIQPLAVVQPAASPTG